MSKYQDIKDEKMDQKKNENKAIRMYIIIGILVLGIFSLIVTPHLLNKAKEVKKPTQTAEASINPSPDYIDFQNNFKQYNLSKDGNAMKVNLPNYFDQNTVEIKKNTYTIKGQNNSSFVVENNIPLTQEGSQIYSVNTLSFYAKTLNELIIPKYPVPDIEKYIQVDDITTGKLNFYVYGYEDNGYFKYFALNVHQKDGKEYLTYYVIQLPQNDNKLYIHNKSTTVSQHQIIVRYILKEISI